MQIRGLLHTQLYVVEGVQYVYESQGITIHDKHFEVIVRQMMRKVEIDDPGDTKFLENEIVNKIAFQEENDEIFGKKVIIDSGDSIAFKTKVRL